MNKTSKMRIGFIHPDLGIGGAERLVVDAALGLQSKGHEVTMYTNHHEPSHCFEETRDGTLSVRVIGDWLPRQILGKFYILCAILRQYVLIAWLIFKKKGCYDVLIVDQLSAGIPLLKWFYPAQVMFYCHFPDKLLSQRTSKLKELYRVPIDLLEEWTTGMADTIAVNSNFTSSVFKSSFPALTKTPKVLYPPINFSAYDRLIDLTDPTVATLESPLKTLISINRFERKKNVELALHSFALLKKESLVSQEVFNEYRLIIAGGYDTRVSENVEYLKELNSIAINDYGLETFTIQPSTHHKPPVTAKVIFLCSFNDAQRTYLLAHSELMLYTPSNEHFGITPVEGMYARLPVIAVNSGGPLETVVDGKTGLLLPPDPRIWANGIRDLITSKYNTSEMGKYGREMVKAKFSLDTFADQLERILEEFDKVSTATSHPYMFTIVIIALFVTWYKY
ncbi:alpha-1,3/1,6-mannosyltransferase ALG2 [Pilobolus umbonatus]|nr:alpha-1,3/1,6-mannosyltransferase ALG2 [Pilobolus umbonatus]